MTWQLETKAPFEPTMVLPSPTRRTEMRPRNLLFIHGRGGAGTGFFWNETLEHLDLTGLRVILADLRGHGESDKATTGFTTERFAQDMFAVADDAGAESDRRPRIQYERAMGAMDGLYAAGAGSWTDPDRTCARSRHPVSR